MISTPLCIKNNDRHILGVWDKPDDFQSDHSKKVCLVCVGLNGNRVEKNRMLLKLSKALTTHGMSVIRFECSGLGVSEGDFWNSSVRTKVDDTLKVIKEINSLYPNETLEWNLLSYSDGISVVLALLELENMVFNKLVAWSPILFPTTSEIKVPMRFVREPKTKQLVIPFGGLWLGKEYLRDLSQDTNLYDKLVKYASRVCCIWGLEDYKVQETIEKLRMVQDIKKAYIQGADHEFNSSQWLTSVIQHTLQWLIIGD